MKLGGTLCGMRGLRIAREGRGAGIDQADEIGPRRNLGQRIGRIAVVFLELVKEERGGAANSPPAEKPIMPIFLGSNFHSAA